MENPSIKPYFHNQFGEKSIGEQNWQPHPRNALSDLNPNEDFTRVECGPDWSSGIRCASPVTDPDIEAKFPSKWTGRRYFPGKDDRTFEEWLLSPCSGGNGIKCYFCGEARANRTSFEEIHLEDNIGSRRKVKDTRGGIPWKYAGDKSYFTPEYSREFHKHGSTLPAVDFSRSNKVITDTFIPLQSLPIKPRESYTELEEKRKKEREKEEVLLLDSWKPADPLKAGF